MVTLYIAYALCICCLRVPATTEIYPYSPTRSLPDALPFLGLLASHRGDVFTRAVQAKAGKLEPADMDELRDYGVGAQILTGLGIEEMVLLTNSHHTLVGLDGYGLSIVGERPIIES